MKLPTAFVLNTTQANAIAEIPKGSHLKYTYHSKTDTFTFSKVLPEELSLGEIDLLMLKDVIQFFITYNEMNSKKFKPLGNKGLQAAIRLIEKQLSA